MDVTSLQRTGRQTALKTLHGYQHKTNLL